MDVTAAASLATQIQALQAMQSQSLAAVKEMVDQQQGVVQLVSDVQAAPPPGVGTVLDITA